MRAASGLSLSIPHLKTSFLPPREKLNILTTSCLEITPLLLKKSVFSHNPDSIDEFQQHQKTIILSFFVKIQENFSVWWSLSFKSYFDL